MSSDGQDPGAIWQGPANANWNQPPEQVPGSDLEELPRSPHQQQTGAFYAGTPLPADSMDDQHNAGPGDDVDVDVQAADTAPRGLLDQIRHYLTLMIAPLLFGGITGLIVLPQIALRHAAVPPAGFWPVTIVLIAIATAQGVAVHHAGDDNGLWALSMLGGFFFFLLAACFALFGPIPGFLLLVVLTIVAIFMARRCIHPVPEGFADIVFSAKKYSRTLYPGFNVLLPWEEIAAQLNTAETQWICPTQTVQLSRDEDVVLRAVISYQLLPEDAHLAITQVNNWEESVRDLFINTLQTIATLFKPEDFLSWPNGLQARHSYEPEQQSEDDFKGGIARRERINTYLFQHMRDKVAPWGVQINWASIRDVELAPHGVIVVDTQQPEPEPQPQPAAQPAQVVLPAVSAKQPVPVGAAQTGKSMPKPSEPTTVKPPAATATPPQLPKEEFLIKIYKEVQDGHISDPDTIRGFAAKFEQVAQDPQASQTVSFDPARAALNLYEQARKYEERQSHINDDATKPDWKVAPPH